MEANVATSIYDTEISCPICNNKFKTKKVRSRHMRLSKRDPDFCPHYSSVNPLFYTAYVCPNCGYAALDKHFSEISVHSKVAVLKNITPKWVKKDFSGIRDLNSAIDIHKLVLKSYTAMDYPSSEIGKLCLKIAWFYRYRGDSKEMAYLKHSLKLLDQSYDDESLGHDPKNEANILYLMGEINRQIGNYTKSIEWFSMALKSPGMAGNRQLEKLTRDQWSEAKFEYNKAKKEVIS